MIVLYVLKKRQYYRDNKYQEVADVDSDKEYEFIHNPPAEDSERQPIPVTVSLHQLPSHVRTQLFF